MTVRLVVAAVWLVHGLFNKLLGGSPRHLAIVQAVLTVLAFGALLLLFAYTDLSVKLVVDNSHSAKPLIYNATRTGVQKGELRKVDLGGGRSGFALAADGG